MGILAGIIGIASFLVFIAGVVGLFKPSLLDNKDKPNEKPATRKTALGFIAFSFLLSVISVIVAPNPDKKAEAQNAEPQKSEQSAKPAEKKVDHSEDLQKFSEYHKKLNIPFNDMEDTYKQLGNALQNIKKPADLVTAYALADDLENKASKVMLETRTISLDDDKADEQAKKYSDSVNMLAYEYKKIAEIAKKVTNGESSMKPSEQLEFQKLIKDQQISVMQLVTSMMATYEALGVKMEQIDTKNGGLKN